MEDWSQAKTKEWDLPEGYRDKVLGTGSVERMEYQTNSYDSRNLTLLKNLNVYLPKGYEDTDENTRYDVFYLMHGGGENQHLLLGGPGENTEFKNILDHMIEDQVIRPIIVVTPTFYTEGREDVSFLSQNFYQELVHEVIPAVESRYNTYADGVTKEELVKARDHRAFGGFSMGGACTWSNFIHCLDYFRYFMPLSGDCWVIKEKGGCECAEETAKVLADAAVKQGYTKADYDVFCATGKEDIAYPNLTPQVEAMKKHTGQFEYTPDGQNGNFCYFVKEGAVHWWHFVYDYIYLLLPLLFREK